MHCRDKKRRESHNRQSKPKREEKKPEVTRRDPSKSNKDIERDKLRTKRDSDNKILAEKEKAIKNLLDSGNIVPPGTEVEVIQSYTEKQNQERSQSRSDKIKERRRSAERFQSSPKRRSSDKSRPSPSRRRSPVASFELRKSPSWISSDLRSTITLSPESRRSPFKRSRERKLSQEKRWSTERHRRHVNSHER